MYPPPNCVTHNSVIAFQSVTPRYTFTFIPITPTDTPNESVYALIGYKPTEDYIVTLGIPHDSKTNLDRQDVVDDKYAMFRTSSAVVLRIESKDDSSVTYEAINTTDIPFTYKVNTKIIFNDYPSPYNGIHGIYFYKTRDAAYYHNKESYIPKKMGEFHFKECYANGVLRKDVKYINGKLNGPCKKYFESGKLYEECSYVNGNKDGPCKSYYDNGQLYEECSYVNGNMDGQYKRYWGNGQMMNECLYVNGKISGSLTQV